MELNYLYKFDFDILFNSKLENGILKCSSVRCDESRKMISKRDSLLFDQIKKCKSKDIKLEEILVILDFSKFISKHSMEELDSIKSIELKVKRIEKKDDEILESKEEITINVVDFLKSNSMSKDCQVYYINSLVTDINGNNLYDSLISRVFFDFHKNQTVLSKLYAYSGTICSDCTLLDNIRFNPDEVVVVEDSNYIFKSDCITMVSIEYLYDKMVKIKKYLEDYKDKTLKEIFEFNSYLEIESIKNSIDLPENQDKDLRNIKDFIKEFYQISRISKEEFINGLAIMIDYYADLGSNNDEVEWVRIIAKNYPFDLNLYDGEGLISKEFCDLLTASICEKLGNNKYKKSSSFQIRLPYVKGMVHSCDIKGFFKEKGVTFVEHTILCGNKKYDINKVKMILTKSQFKAESFIDSSKMVKTVEDYINLINQYNYPFGVIDANKEDKNTCSLEYQFISTLPLSTLDIKELFLFNKWFINDSCSKERIIESLYNDNNPNAKKEIELYKINPQFYFNTRKYKTRKKDVFKKLKNNAIISRFTVHGRRRYLSGDLLGLLYHVAFHINYEKFKGKYLPPNNYYMAKVEENELNNSVFLRSPHYSRNEIVMLGFDSEYDNLERDKYFSHLDGVVMINPASLAVERLGGADFDGDTVLVVNDYTIVNCVKNKLFEKQIDNKLVYKYLPCKIPSLKGKKMSYLNYSQRLICFQNTFSSRVGKISNAGFIDATHIYGNDNSIENNHDEIAEYTILSGLEIDSAKSGKKPKLGDKLKGKFTDSIYKEFLLGKKEYEETGSLKTITSMLSSNFKRVTEVLDYMGYVGEEMEIKDDYTNNVLNVGYNMNEIAYFNNKEIIKPKYKCKEPQNLVKALAIAKAYSAANKILRNVISEKAKQAKVKLLNRICEQIEIITQNKNLDYDYVLSSLQMDNIEAYAKLSDYIKDNKFHYLIDVEERKNYIKELLPNLDDDIVQMLTSFDKDGYRLLFMLLSLNYNTIDKIEIKVSNNGEVDRKVDLLNAEQKQLFKDYYECLLKNINNIFNQYFHSPIEEIKDKIYSYLANESSGLKFTDVYNSINVFESNMIYDVYFDIVKAKLIKRGNKNA